MRILRSAGVWTAAGGLMLALGVAAWGNRAVLATRTGEYAWGMQWSRIGECGVAASSRPNHEPQPSLEPPDIVDSPQTEEAQAKLRNVERQKQLVADTQKLLSLANELKDDVDKSTKDTMSLDVIRKADEIEKLAHNVKEKMKGP